MNSPKSPERNDAARNLENAARTTDAWWRRLDAAGNAVEAARTGERFWGILKAPSVRELTPAMRDVVAALAARGDAGALVARAVADGYPGSAAKVYAKVADASRAA